MLYFFFFQAEDGIRDYKVTGVQTCALPIFREQSVVTVRVSDRQGCHERGSGRMERCAVANGVSGRELFQANDLRPPPHDRLQRSEERRVGKECGWRREGGE